MPITFYGAYPALYRRLRNIHWAMRSITFPIYLLGTVFVEISTGLNSFINAQGRPAIAMCSVLIGALLNIILDPIFIFWFDMG